MHISGFKYTFIHAQLKYSKNVLSKQIVSVKQIRKSREKKKSECRRFASLAKRKRVNVECLEIDVVEILI